MVVSMLDHIPMRTGIHYYNDGSVFRSGNYNCGRYVYQKQNINTNNEDNEDNDYGNAVFKLFLV